MSLLERIAIYATQPVSWEQAGHVESARNAGIDVSRLSRDQQQSYFQCMSGSDETRRILGDTDGRTSARLCFDGVFSRQFVERLLTTSTSDTLRLINAGFTPVASMECGATMSCETECGRTMSCDPSSHSRREGSSSPLHPFISSIQIHTEDFVRRSPPSR